MTLYVIIKTAYGVKRVYPACERSLLICKLIGTSTIPPHAVSIIKQLGISLVVVETKIRHVETLIW